MFKQFAIEPNVKIPDRNNRGTQSKFPISQMSVGDSFFIPAETVKEQIKVRSAVYSARNSYQMTNNVKVTIITRQVHESEGAGVRVWRTA